MKQSTLAWIAIVCGLFLFVYFCWGVFTPFVISLTIAYLWSPVASLFEKKLRIDRWIIASLLVIITVAVLLSIVLVLLPLIYHQVVNFIELIPQYKQFIEHKIMPVIAKHLGGLSPEYLSLIKESIADLFGSGLTSLALFIKKIWSSGFAIIDVLWLVLLVPFITFHFIKDWDSLLFRIKNLVPIERQRIVQQFFADVDRVISGVIRGQFNVSIILGLYYTVALSLVGLEYSTLLGITTGIVNFIPFIGLIASACAAAVVAYSQFASIKYVLLTLLVYVVGAVFDGGFLSPKLIGRRVGLHSVWSMFAILLGAKLLGFIGMVIAIPCGATIGLVIKMVLKHYYKSKLYATKNIKVKRA
jgi:predicted PurR-regulated permease PerM